MASTKEKHNSDAKKQLISRDSDVVVCFPDRIQLSVSGHFETTVCLTFGLESVTFIANFGYTNIHAVEHCTGRLDSHS